MNKRLEEEMKTLTKEELISYAGFLESNFWNMQGNWMLNITNSYGTDIAAEFDAKVFDRNGKVQAWKIKKALDLQDSMKDFAKAITLSTLFSNVAFEFPEISDNRVQLLVTNCVMQMNRLKLALPELPCKKAGVAACEGFASAFNSNLKTTCLQCPPDEHPDDRWCHWLFEIQK